ncbi:MAG: hypothetical protein M5U34_21015 [Chloroflexi bacterium]|nr:hypothetical protein [Chloroflexota bacterium]
MQVKIEHTGAWSMSGTAVDRPPASTNGCHREHSSFCFIGIG